MRIACSQHSSIFSTAHFALTPHFPQISTLCYQACELVLPTLMRRGRFRCGDSRQRRSASLTSVLPVP